MRINLNNKEAEVAIHHFNAEEFVEKYPNLVKNTCINAGIIPNKISVAEISYDGLSSVGLSFCHENDNFSRKMGGRTALSRSMKQHPSLRGKDKRLARRTVHEVMFRAGTSVYDELANLVRSRPTLAAQLLEFGKTKLGEYTIFEEPSND